MRKLQLAALTGILIFALAGCGASGDHNSVLTEEDASSAERREDVFTAKEINILKDKYVDLSDFPELDIDLKPEIIFDDRTLKIRDSIDNELENIVYQNYYLEMAGEYEKRMELIGENEALWISMKNEEKHFEEGRYMSEYTLHQLSVLSAEDVQKALWSDKRMILNNIEKFGLNRYAVVKADLSWKHNAAWLAAGPQLGDGKYTRYYLLASKEGSDEFKIYEIFWEEFLEY